MKGQFEVSQDMIDGWDNDKVSLIHYIIGQLLNNPNHNIGWFARRLHPVTGNMVYLFDTELPNNSTQYLLSYQADGWELAYEIKK